MTTARGSPSGRSCTNGDETVYWRKDGRWEAAGYVLAPGNTRHRVRVYGTTRKEALAKLTEKIAASNKGVPALSPQAASRCSSPTGLETVAVHRLRETTHTHPLHRLRSPVPAPQPGTEEAR
jgi:hypothetical protein